MLIETRYNAHRGNRQEDTQLAELGHTLLAMLGLPGERAKTNEKLLYSQSVPSRLIEIDGKTCKVVPTTAREEDYVALSHC